MKICTMYFTLTLINRLQLSSEIIHPWNKRLTVTFELIEIVAGYFNPKNFSLKWDANYFKVCITWEILHSNNKKWKPVTSAKTHDQLFFSKFWCPEIKRMPQKVTCSPFSTDVFKDIFLIKSFRIFLPSLIAVKLSFKQQIINYKIKSNYQISWQLRGHVCIPNPLILIMIIRYALSIKS